MFAGRDERTGQGIVASFPSWTICVRPFVAAIRIASDGDLETPFVKVPLWHFMSCLLRFCLAWLEKTTRSQ